MLGLLLRYLVKELSVNVLRNTGYGGGVYENESEVKIKMAIYCPQGSGTLRQQLLSMLVMHDTAWY